MAEGAGLLNRFTVKSRNGGSNPPLSATFKRVFSLFWFSQRFLQNGDVARQETMKVETFAPAITSDGRGILLFQSKGIIVVIAGNRP